MLDNKKNIAIEALTELAADQGGKSEIAKLREIIDHIELTLASGVSHAKVHETLKATLGIRMSLGTFEKNLHLIRKKRKNSPFKEMAKKNEEIESGSKQLSAVPTIVTKAIETNTEGSKKFISPGDIKKARLKIWEEEKSFEDNYNYDNEEK